MLEVAFCDNECVTIQMILRHDNVLEKALELIEKGGVGRSISSCFSPFMRRDGAISAISSFLNVIANPSIASGEAISR
jgi:hypothetical protein